MHVFTFRTISIFYIPFKVSKYMDLKAQVLYHSLNRSYCPISIYIEYCTVK